MRLSAARLLPQVVPVGETSPGNRQLSGPGDSTSRSRSLISTPPASARSGGSGQARATRSVPTATARPPPAPPVVLEELTRKVFSVQPAPVGQFTGLVLLIGGSPVPR